MQTYRMAGHLIRRLNQISTQTFSKHVQSAGFDLTPVQFAALDAIANCPGIDQAGVAAMIAYDRATIGGVIDRLEQKALIERSVSKRDRRAREVRLSQQGSQLLEAILPFVWASQDEILTELDSQERALFLQLAQKVINGTPQALPSESDAS